MRVPFGLAALVLLHAASANAACNLATGLAPFQLDEGAKPTDSSSDVLEAPQVEVVSLTRGVGGLPESCDASGILVLDLKRNGGDYKIDELGFEFRIVGTGQDHAIFPPYPLSVTTGKRRSEVIFMWSDDDPAQQKPLVLEVEVRPVTHSYLRGPAARLLIDSRQLDD